MSKESIAIIGIGCRFPGGIHDTASFWKLLMEGREAVGEIPSDRFNIERFYDPEPAIPGKSVARRGGFLDSIDQYDPQFFGISPREAPYVDPQQRLLLETSWEAIEDAGLVLDLERGTDIAVFTGISHNDYQGIQATPWDHAGIGPHSAIGSAHSIAANRISYCLNLRGPSVAMDTACSSALTAVYAACEHLRSGRGEVALAGGVTVIITPGGFIGFSQASMLSPDGRCKAFDADADGFVRGEGAAMVVLKRLSQAIADGDPIHGVIAGGALNQDGHTNGISLPNPEAQARLVSEACADAEADPAAVVFVEAHGTGTIVGDPLEAHALSKALCETREEPLLIGSVKTNLGHLETAAGMAGMIKAMLALKHGCLPPSLHFQTPNPYIDFNALKLRVVTQPEPLPGARGSRLAGVNSFGFGGANTHLILSEPPLDPHQLHGEIPTPRPWPLTISARSEGALRANAARVAAWLEEHANANGSSPLLPDLTYTLGCRRNHHPFRLTLVAETMTEAVQELAAFGAGQQSVKIRTAFAPRPEQAPRVAFVMSGQGPQWFGMGRELMEREPVFRDAMERCAAAMRLWEFELFEELEHEARIASTRVAQPAIFAMQIALSELWKSWGVQPAAVVGHSVGEIAAAAVAGIFSLEEAARIIVLRARFMDECARGEGTMLAVGMDEEAATALIARHDRTVKIAAHNAPRSLTLAGPRISLEAMHAELEGREVFARMVRVDHPFHHPLMEPAAQALEDALAGIVPGEESAPLFSTVTGGRVAGIDCGPGHWGNGVRQPVQFARAVEALTDFGIDAWLEISPHPALAHSLQECLAVREKPSPIISSARREREHEAILEAAMDLHRHCVPLDFSAMTPSRRQLPLPAYAWERSRWWTETREWRDARLGDPEPILLGSRMPRANPTWLLRLDARHAAYLKDHKVDDFVIFPAAAFIEMALEAGAQIFEGRPFAIEDLEIRKPLLLPEQISDILLEFSYDAAERTFTIQSRLERGAGWSLHAIGSLRGERTESAFVDSVPREMECAEPVEKFYDALAEKGLRYGAEFRSIRAFGAAPGASAGVVALSEAAAKRAPAYCLHPVLMDGALHVFSAGALALEDRKAQLKLPVRFSRILYLRSPGASSRVNATVQQSNNFFVEGRIELFDQTGAPCVLVEGFRAVAVAGQWRSGGNVVYHPLWERSASGSIGKPGAPAPLSQLHRAAHATLEGVMALRGRDRMEASLGIADDLAATHLAKALHATGIEEFTPDSLQVSAAMRPACERLLAALTRRGLFTDGRPTAAFHAAADSADSKLRETIENHPGSLAEALLCATTTAELVPILRGEKDAVQVLFAGAGPELLGQFYGESLCTSHWLAAIAAAAEEAARHFPEGRGLRILEIGAGTGGLAAHLLPMLERNLHSYTFSDISPAFFGAAGQKLSAFPEVEFKVLDLEKPAAAQGFLPEAYDLIVGTNVIHAVAELRPTLCELHALLAPGGSLVFMDVANSQLWTDSVFGLTQGWWRFADRDLRPDQPLLQRNQWENLLRECGFAETSSLAGLVGSDGEGQIGLLARKQWLALAESTPAFAAPAEKSWQLFADDSCELATRLATTLEQCGADVCRVRPGQEIPAPAQRIVFFAPQPPEELLRLAQSLDTAETRFDLITRGAQPAGRDANVTAPDQTALIGLLRVIVNEVPGVAARAIDLPPNSSPLDFQMLWNELQQTDHEREIAFRGEARYVQRIQRGLPAPERLLPTGTPLRLEVREPGHIESLHFAPFTEPSPGAGKVLVEVKAAGMNFRDVLKALALYPGEAPDRQIFGDEIAGIVKSVGPGVTHLQPGDRVFGLAPFGFSTAALARGGDMQCIPDGVPFEEAATLPVVFMTAWHALQNVARIRKGETILVHAGAGGVGMAAIQLARLLGADVIASAGSPAKRSLLKTLGAREVIDSRRGDFTETVMALTAGRGVDVVLNALAGEAIPMGLACLAEFGRFVEIGKRDIYLNSRIPLRPMRNNASFHVVAMDSVFAGDEALTSAMLEQIATLVAQGDIHPLPFRSFPATRIHAAFRLMSSGRHTGKIIVTFPREFLPPRGEPLRPGFAVRADGCYLITGAFGGYGQVLARWLVESGARHLVLTSRSGAATPEAQAFVESLPAKVRVIKADIGSTDDVERVMAEIEKSGQPLRGVFHLAMVIDDVPLSAMTPERFQHVFAPKAHGAWLLHEATRAMPLDCFVMFSSVSSIFGNPTQVNYATANAFLDALAHHRRALGLPALTVNWGMLGGAGYVARNERVSEFLSRQGSHALSPLEVTTLLENALAAGAPQVIGLRVEWSKWRQNFRRMQENPLLEHVFAAVAGQEARESLNDLRQKIESASPEELDGLILQAVRVAVASVLRVKPESLREDQPLSDLGLDSLMGVEIENAIEISIGVSLPPASLLRARTIGQIVPIIAGHLGAKRKPATTVEVVPDEIDFDAIPDEEIEKLLALEQTPA